MVEYKRISAVLVHIKEKTGQGATQAGDTNERKENTLLVNWLGIKLPLRVLLYSTN